MSPFSLWPFRSWQLWLWVSLVESKPPHFLAGRAAPPLDPRFLVWMAGFSDHSQVHVPPQNESPSHVSHRVTWLHASLWTSRRMRDQGLLTSFWSVNLCVSPSCILCFTKPHCTILALKERNPITASFSFGDVNSDVYEWYLISIFNLHFLINRKGDHIFIFLDHLVFFSMSWVILLLACFSWVFLFFKFSYCSIGVLYLLLILMLSWPDELKMFSNILLDF